MPRVSVVIPTFNRRDMVREAVASALAQTLPDVEVIVVDDGSTDGTADALRAEFGDRIQVVEQVNQGESVARNRGIALACAEYVAFLDSDDWWEPEKLARQVEVLDARPDVVLVTSGYRYVKVGGRYSGVVDVRPPADTSIDAFALAAIGVENPLGAGSSTVILRRSALREAGLFDPSIRYGEDYDLWLRLRLTGAFAVVADSLACIRVHDGSQYRGLTPDVIDERLECDLAMTNRFFDRWPTEPPAGLRERCLARRYVSIACMDFVIGRHDLARQRLERAIGLDSALARNHDRNIALQFGWTLRRHLEVAESSALGTMKTFDAAMEAWPAALRPIPYPVTKWLNEEVFGSLGWRMAMQGEWREARRCLMRVVRVDPSLAFNRGFWSIIVRSVTLRNEARSTSR